VIVVANTSPINYLVLVEQIHLLERLYRKVVLPEVVFGELQAAGTPEAVRHWVKTAPNWLEVRPIGASDLLDLPSSLHRGEKEAIGLARKLAADYVILDDRDGRRVAQDLGLNVTGTLGVLGRADEQGLTPDLPHILKRLESETNFRIHRPAVDLLLARHRGGTSG
jgi:predicted nucleic acid-binding protein